MKKRICVVVSDSSAARLFLREGRRAALEELETLTHPESRLHGHDLRTDGPGRAFDSAGQGRHAMASDPKSHESDVFAKEVARALGALVGQESPEEVVLVAPPRFLGRLRPAIDESVRRLVRREIPKDVARATPAEIAAYLDAES